MIMNKKGQASNKKEQSGSKKGPSSEKKEQSAFMKPMQLSKELEAVVGKGPMPRTEVTSRIWDYIKKYKLQDVKNKKDILPDAQLKDVLKKDKVNMFEMTKIVSTHLTNIKN